MKRYKKLLLPALFALMFISCAEKDRNQAMIEQGRDLSEKYCQSCHELPSPDDLTKEVWNEILPLMGAKMGLATSDEEIRHRQILQQTDMAYGESALILPAGTISLNEWLLIKHYYRSISPDSFLIAPTAIATTPQQLFREIPITIPDVRAASSLVRFGRDGEILYGDAQNNVLYNYRIPDQTFQTTQLSGAPSHVTFEDQSLRILTMGNIHPNDFQNGTLVEIKDEEKPEELLTGLQRPVHVNYADLNNDGLEDIVVCSFGYLKGNLSWYENTGGGYTKHTLKNMPGALKTELIDLNKDGHLDILALIAQGDEGFYLFRGDGQGNFSEQKIYNFPPSYGSSYFELADFNRDGLPDILYVNGDNGDYSKPVHKPYQGIRILTNQGNTTFEESYHFHINGPFKAIAQDFDLDGHLDIACISYFPDYNRTPQEGFLLLKNKGHEKPGFEAFSTPGAINGKWLVADCKDYDADGDMDLLLGNSLIMSLNVPEEYRKRWNEQPVTMLLLENKTR